MNTTIQRRNLIETINEAGAHIYIVAKSDSQNIDKEMVEALKEARKCEVPVHVAIHQTSTELPEVWKEIKSFADTFKTDVPVEKLTNRREIIIVDDNLYTQTLTDGKWVEAVEKKSTQIDTVASEFFNIAPNALSENFNEYRYYLDKGLQWFKNGMDARARLKMGGLFRTPTRRDHKLIIEKVMRETYPKPSGRRKIATNTPAVKQDTAKTMV